MVELFKEGAHMSIVSDAKDETVFLNEISEAFSRLVETKEFDGDWEHQFVHWLPQVVDICCAYRNYKNSVVVRKQLIAGDYYPVAEHSVIVVGQQKELKRIDGRDKGDSV